MNDTDLYDPECLEWQHSLSSPMKAFPDYGETLRLAHAKTGEGYRLTMVFYYPRGDRYGVLYLEKFRDDDMSHYEAYEDERARTPQEAEEVLAKWGRKYGFKCPCDKQGRLF